LLSRMELLPLLQETLTQFEATSLTI
jgi:hypothetical protein